MGTLFENIIPSKIQTMKIKNWMRKKNQRNQRYLIQCNEEIDEGVEYYSEKEDDEKKIQFII